MQKDIPRKKFLETLSFVLPTKTTVLQTTRSIVVLAGRTILKSFQKLFAGISFAFVEYLCNRSPKIKTKNIKNYSSILAIINHHNWLDNSLPLNTFFLSIVRLILPYKLFSKHFFQAIRQDFTE